VSGVYLYALLGTTPATSPGVGVTDEPLRIVELGGLFALVGDVPAAPPPTPATLTAQDAVLRRLALGVDAILPARFGTLLTDDATLVESLMARRTELTRALAHVMGCEQMTLRVWGERAAPQPDADVSGSGPGARHDRPPLLATVQHLVPRGESATYLAEVEAAGPRLAPWRVTVTGPWLPYAFAEAA
jgi:hypothetical protein